MFERKNVRSYRILCVKVSLQDVWGTQQRVENEAVKSVQCSYQINQSLVNLSKLRRKGLQLADFPLAGADDPELSVLIGTDYYWQVVLGKVQRIT